MTKTTDVREAVAAELTFDPLVDASGISARSLVDQVHNHLGVELRWNTKVPAGLEATAHNGDITLTGTVRYGSERADRR